MRIIARSSFALGLAAAIALIGSAAANAQAYGPGYGPWGDDSRYGHLPSYRGGAYDAYGAGPGILSGTSMPYDASGPGWNDFQLQGR